MKSFLLSFIIVLGICIFFMSIFEPKASAFYNKFPEWLFITLAVICLGGLLLSLYWGIFEMVKGQRTLNVMGIFFSIFGIGIFVLGYVMDSGRGKESRGQFDHELSMIDSTQRRALDNLMSQTGTKPADVEITAYFKMSHHPGKFVVCIQKGNVIALQIRNKSLAGFTDINAFHQLNWLALYNCGLQSLSGLDLPLLQRLSVDNNQLTSLHGIENSPDLKWLEYSGNPITDSSAAKVIADKNLYVN